MEIEKGCALEIVGGSGQKSLWPAANSENLSRFLQLSSEASHEGRDEHGGLVRGKRVMCMVKVHGPVEGKYYCSH